MGIEISQVLAIGGPSSVVSAIFVVLVNAYLSARKDKREAKSADTQNDGAIVDNAKKVIELVRSETERMGGRIAALEKVNAEQGERIRGQDTQINSQDDRIARQDRELEFLKQDLERAHTEIEEMRGRGTRARRTS